LVGVAAVGPAGALAGQPVAAVGPADGRPGPGGGLAGPAFAVQLHDHVGAQDRVLLVTADPLVQLSRWQLSGWKDAEAERHKHRIQAGVAGRPVRWRAAAIARCRIASGLRAACRGRGG
jgi:hypothetical protein